MYLLSRQEMYDCDRYTIDEMGIPGKVLMENAGRGSAEYIRDHILTAAERIIIFCGSGNNGGDGFVIGRYLQLWGCDVQIVLTGKPDKMTPETRENYAACLEMGIAVNICLSYQDWQDIKIDIKGYGMVIDAIFGVGFKGSIRGWIAELVKEINQKSRLTVAIDIASGINADNGKAEIAIEADHTLTMAAVKYGSVLGAGKSYSGKIEVIDIGMPPEVIEKHKPAGRLVTLNTVKLPERKGYFHKGNYGRIAIIAGSPGYSGAAVLASRAALRSGAGLITLFHPQGMELIFEIQLLEVMTKVIPTDLSEFEEQLAKFDVVLFGPGVGISEKTFQILELLVHKWHKPLIIDADGLNLLSGRAELLQDISGKQVLITPHIGEFSRLSGINVKDILADPANVLMDFCRKNKLMVLLKSSTTIFCDGRVLYFIASGNDGLATGGSGDVLSGIISSFAGQGLDMAEAGIAASWVLGTTAEKLAEQRETRSIIPSDIIENIFKNC
ncbi:MAG: NAD(P)H-hydrate dehydratase [Candidatus Cloacimonetes bacterium]|nr:NAD(P)H-hydrate dehydratase [Candidatus Cloacimonadota bacterium]